ncbi:MAG: tRNA lysidine(34) synthetase TilS [Candidatus Nanopelagicus sp.]
MIKLLFPLPKNVTIALSGGVDSVAITDFLSKKHNVSCAFFHHATAECQGAYDFVQQFCSDRSLPLTVGKLLVDKPKELSMEEHWRNERYVFLSKFETVVTGHNLDDCVETYLFSALNGTAKVIPSHRNNVFRPFLTTTKAEFVDWCLRKNIEWYQDASNDDDRYNRNYIRKHLIPHALKVNPGLFKVVKKIVENKQKA